MKIIKKMPIVFTTDVSISGLLEIVKPGDVVILPEDAILLIQD